MRRLLAALALLNLVLLATAPPAPSQSWERRDLVSFGQRDPLAGERPADPSILGGDGALYGTTELGGAFHRGVIYRFHPADRSYAVLHHFTGPANGVGNSMGSTLCQASDGRLYGLALNPRLFLYSLATDGSDFRAHFTFPVGAEEGSAFNLINWLRPGPDGRLYGLYQTGSINGAHVAHFFRIDRDGSNFQPLGTALDVTSPLSFGTDGRLYGTTFSSVFRLESDGTGFTTLQQFPVGQSGSTVIAEGGVLHHSNGFLYGFTTLGGPNGFGMFYRLRPDGSEFSILFQPSINVETGHLRAPCFEGPDGYIYGSVGEDGFGTTSFVWRIRPDGSGWQVLKRINFNGRGTNGVTLAPDGFLYGFTTSHPDNNCLFRVGRDGSGYEIVWRFAEDDAFPLTPIALVRGSDQRFYGLTSENGTGGRGTFFRVSPDGSNLVVLRDFGVGPAAEQGNVPKALCASADGQIYGVVRQLGSAGAGIFRYQTASGEFSWIQGLPPGQTADYAGLVAGSDGLLYAAIDSSPSKTERLFRLHPSGTGLTVLHTFNSSSASFAGSGALTEAPDGLLYGITMRNGSATLPQLFRIARDGSGFQALTEINAGTFAAATPRGLLVTPAGQVFGHASTAFWRCQSNGTGFTVLRNFSETGYGENPLLGFDGKVYSTQRFGPAGGGGGLFRINPDGSGYEEVVSFPPLADPLGGKYPCCSLVTGPDGAFYGLTAGGGFANHGTLFRVATPTQLVGIAPATYRITDRGRFEGAVVGPPARPVDVWRSDDLVSWSLLQRIAAPEINAGFSDASTLPGRRFYRATAP